ncbi:division/outer membrane stress-associated lipid-binding lipoprotein [Pseudoalteromonas sp. S16_S37]|uniref:division/outer membrane stress-associated lipid-binding lipoprotein n=1 Tax=Pseudoalteromonas sp. S16_S37 TaxID=2720228 RepID=UPI0016814A56|nr:division/outer membrane stress-associated lipid-binding lipoprotein [Pseudoalteromonas sp. S16_S37]MBD1581023.1 divisome-associated lipoprotein YraP [Pseudoalteromonas sp. S16_S37]
MLVKPIALLLSITLLQGCAAAVVAGTAGAISAADDRRTIGSQLDDNNIEIKGMIAIRNVERLKEHANISLISVNGVVLMVGQVANIEMKEQAQKTLQGIAAIRQIHNQLRISSNIGVATQTHDVWLTSKVKTKLLAADDVSGNNIKVVTENSEVFLMGLVSQEEANRAVEIARHVNGVARVIKAFEYL